MLRGWLAHGLLQHAFVVDHAVQELKLEFSEYAHALDFYIDAQDLPEEVETDLVVLAIKPQQMAEVLTSLAPRMHPDWPMMTVAAGVHSSFYQRYLPQNPIVRIAPNTPAMQGEGMTVGVVVNQSPSGLKQRVEKLCRSMGEFFWLEEEAQIDGAMAISGSGPAYYFYLTEMLAKTGIAYGLSQDQAMQLARQTLVGAGAMAKSQPEVEIAQMRKDVTSKGGITEATLRVWSEGDSFEKIIAAGISANVQRSRELAGD